MLATDFVSFDFVKKSVTILQILEHYGITETFKQKGDGLVGPCPIHGGNSLNCFRVSISKNCFNCFGECKSGGNILDFVSKKEKVTIRKAALLIQKWFQLTSSTGSEKKPTAKDKTEEIEASATSSKEPMVPNAPLSFVLKNLVPAHPSIASLGISEETRVTFGLGFCTKGLLAGYIAIPIHNKEGILVAYAGLWPNELPNDKVRYKFPPGFRKSLEVFNLHRAIETKEKSPLVVVRDCHTCIKLQQAGVRRVVAIMNNSLSNEQANLIEGVNQIDGRIILLFDETPDECLTRTQIISLLAQKGFVKAPLLAFGRTLIDGLSHQEIKTLAF